MISTTSSVKEFSEDIPCHITDGIFISDIFFEDNKSSVPLILWRFNDINKKASGIKICFTNGTNYFPINKEVDIKTVKIRYKNNKVIDSISKKIETDRSYQVFDNVDYSFCETSKNTSVKGSPGIYKYLDGRMESFTRYIAPEGFIGEYQITMKFNEIIKLKKADTLELQMLITENGETTEITKIFHFDIKYRTSTESMFGAWVRMH